jgi:type VI secretion system protein VasD
MTKPFALLLICMTLGGCNTFDRVYKVLKDPTLRVGGPSNDISRVALSLYAADLPITPRPQPADAEGSSTRTDYPGHLSANLSAVDAVTLSDKVKALAEQLHENYPGSVDDDNTRAPAELASYADGPSEPPPAPDQSSQRQGPSSIAFKILQLRDDSLLLDATYEQVEEDLDKALGTTLISVDDFRLLPGHFKYIEPEEINERTRYIAVIARLGDSPDGKWKDTLRIQPRGYDHTVHVHFENNGVELRHDREYRRDQ